jgi:hypothetical protein
MEDELKWMTPRKAWKYIPNRYQALTAQITAALLFFNLFDVLFKQADSATFACGSLVRPILGDDDNTVGWFWNILGNIDNSRCPRTTTGLFWEFFFTIGALAVCGIVLRKAIKRMPSEHREATKDL